MWRCANAALAACLIWLSGAANAGAEKITMEQMKAIGRASDFEPGSRFVPADPKPGVFTGWIYLTSLSADDERALCDFTAFARSAKGEVKVFLPRTFRGADAKTKTPCFSALGAVPAWKRASDVFGQPSEPTVALFYHGRRARQPLALWKNAVREVDDRTRPPSR